jgi:hypothetical protein
MIDEEKGHGGAREQEQLDFSSDLVAPAAIDPDCGALKKCMASLPKEKDLAVCAKWYAEACPCNNNYHHCSLAYQEGKCILLLPLSEQQHPCLPCLVVPTTPSLPLHCHS